MTGGVKKPNTNHTGKIIKGVGGVYEVYVEGLGVVDCSARGNLRYLKTRPLIGDNVELALAEDGSGHILRILKRRNELVRPAIANVDQALIVCAVRDPEFHPNLLDRFLILMARQNVPVLVCFNKTDLAEDGDAARSSLSPRPVSLRLLRRFGRLCADGPPSLPDLPASANPPS